MLNQVAVEALYSATYVENYLDSVENLPDDVQKCISRIREIDVQIRAHLRDVEHRYDRWVNTCQSTTTTTDSSLETTTNQQQSTSTSSFSTIHTMYPILTSITSTTTTTTTSSSSSSTITSTTTTTSSSSSCSSSLVTKQRPSCFAFIQQNLIAAQELGDEKLQIVSELQDLIEHKTRQLDHDFKNLDYGKDEQQQHQQQHQPITSTNNEFNQLMQQPINSNYQQQQLQLNHHSSISNVIVTQSLLSPIINSTLNSLIASVFPTITSKSTSSVTTVNSSISNDLITTSTTTTTNNNNNNNINNNNNNNNSNINNNFNNVSNTNNNNVNSERTTKRVRRTRNDTGSGGGIDTSQSIDTNAVTEQVQKSLNISMLQQHQQQQQQQLQQSSNTTNNQQKKLNNTGGKKKKRKSGRQSNAANNNNQLREDTPPIEETIDPDEPTYCLCDQISFGEMILCDNDLCPIEWFHFSCVSLMTKPKGKWFCPNCRGDRPNVMKPKAQFLKELERYNKEKEEKS